MGSFGGFWLLGFGGVFCGSADFGCVSLLCSVFVLVVYEILEVEFFVGASLVEV